ncbi:unnamed protein product [Spirodela intermedia]|uniref:Uncharacterized protein n=1 Tax=Spirodela intermedia TaxID=51605 RepID=A0A7I8IL11_SPIIN|nr:unnamed protein product [Spirodela intermedia]CAA6658583.1 unnamed protein product [Spirodela intermedia]
MATMTSMPEPARALMVEAAASKSFTFSNPLSRSICTTVFGGSWCVACVPSSLPAPPRLATTALP